MQIDELITKVNRLPDAYQQEVLDFVTFLEQRYGSRSATHSDWGERQFTSMSVDQAMRGMEEEPELYSEDDLEERWQ